MFIFMVPQKILTIFCMFLLSWKNFYYWFKKIFIYLRNLLPVFMLKKGIYNNCWGKNVEKFKLQNDLFIYYEESS